MADRLGVGIVGAGGIAQLAHIPNYQKLDGVEVLAIAEPNAETAKKCMEKFGIEKCFEDYRELLKLDGIDVVSVCTPNCLHKAPTIDALQAGKHVLVEKPIGLNAREGREMVEAAKKCSRQLMVGQTTHFRPAVRAMKKLIDAGELGEAYFSRVWALRRRGIPGWGVFTNKEFQGGGPLIDIGVHSLYTALYLMGYPRPVACSGTTYTKFGTRGDVVGMWGQWDHENYTVEDYAAGFVRFENGASMIIESSFAANIEKNALNVVILGDKGGLSLDPMRFYTEKDMMLQNIEPVLPKEKEGYELEVAAFVEAIREGKEVPVPGEKALLVMEIIDALYESAEKGREVRIGA